jgi:FMN phosphatase YigB (HAD superfamily)
MPANSVTDAGDYLLREDAMTTPALHSLREETQTPVGLLEHAPDGGRLYAVAEEARQQVAPKALLFSCDNVLYDATEWERWLAKLLRSVGVPIDQETFSRQWEREFLAEIHCGRRAFDEAFRDYLRQLGLSRGLIDEVAAASQGRRHQCLRETRPMPYIRQTIVTLAQSGLALGLLADSDLTAAELERHLTRLGFGGRFLFVLSSVEIGHTQAETQGYTAAAARFGKPLERVAFVGNHSRHLGTAARMGMPTIAFNYDDHTRADLYLRQFDELIAILADWPLAG